MPASLLTLVSRAQNTILCGQISAGHIVWWPVAVATGSLFRSWPMDLGVVRVTPSRPLDVRPSVYDKLFRSKWNLMCRYIEVDKWHTTVFHVTRSKVKVTRPSKLEILLFPVYFLFIYNESRRNLLLKCVSQPKIEKNHWKPNCWDSRSSKSSMLLPPEMPLAVLVMISSKSVSLQPFSR